MLISMEICAEDLELLMETGLVTLNCISFCQQLVPKSTKNSSGVASRTMPNSPKCSGN
jgi:hypothetical protein